MDIQLNFKHTNIEGEVTLPASKSISNRVLLIGALAGSDFQIENLSDCDDTESMLRVLHTEGNSFDIGHAGTAMRFLTAFLSGIIGKWQITGSERMKQRPIRVLVDALNRLGARIEYLEKEGYPPLQIYGCHLTGGEIDIPASVSSQYISALMMIAPFMDQGLRLHLSGKIVSAAYIEMTRRIMEDFGARISPLERGFYIAPQPYWPTPYRIEADWSAASYFFELLAIAGEGNIVLQGLQTGSMQGDSRQIQVWENLGVSTVFEADRVVLTKTGSPTDYLDYDFVDMPDLVQSFAVACCMRDIPFSFRGVETLRIKETDRIAALITELKKLGYCLKAAGNDWLLWEGEKCPPVPSPCIETYHDHRMAMAFAPAAWKHPGLVIADKEVVSKSFPNYWEELSRVTHTDN